MVDQGGYARASVEIGSGSSTGSRETVAFAGDEGPRDPDSPVARSRIRVPLEDSDICWGYIVIDAAPSEFFGTEEQRLLNELGHSVVFGATAIRARRQQAIALQESQVYSVELEQRVRLIDTIRKLAELFARGEDVQESTLDQTMHLMLEAFRCADSAEARIECCGLERRTDGFRRGDVVARVTEPIPGIPGPAAKVCIEVVYLGPDLANADAFTPEEYDFLRMVARRTAEYRSGLERARGYRAAREQLDETSERLEHALSASNTGVREWHLDSQQLVIDDRWAEMLGYTREELGRTTF